MKQLTRGLHSQNTDFNTGGVSKPHIGKSHSSKGLILQLCYRLTSSLTTWRLAAATSLAPRACVMLWLPNNWPCCHKLLSCLRNDFFSCRSSHYYTSSM